RLEFEHFGVETAMLDELLMRALLGNSAILHHEDAVRHPDRRHPVRNQQGHFARSEVGKAPKDFVLGMRVKSRGWLVQNQQLSITQVGAGQGDFLPLAAGEVDSTLEPATEK